MRVKFPNSCEMYVTKTSRSFLVHFLLHMINNNNDTFRIMQMISFCNKLHCFIRQFLYFVLISQVLKSYTVYKHTCQCSYLAYFFTCVVFFNMSAKTTRGWMLEMLQSTLSWKFRVISSRTFQSRTFFTTCFS